MCVVISPTLNEAENIEALVEGVLSHKGFSLLVVDDNSYDGTHELVERLARHTNRLFLLRRRDQHGFGASYLDGFQWALEGGFDSVLTMDADLSHRPEYLPEFKRALEEGADVVVGSRYAKGGGIKNWSPWRRFLSKGANAFAKAVTGLPVRDSTAGFMGIRTEYLRRIDFRKLTCNGYGFLIELKHALWRAGANIVEIPIVFCDRERGQTKFNSGMIGEAVRICFRLRRLRPGRE